MRGISKMLQMRRTHTREFCAPCDAAKQTGWINRSSRNPQSQIRNRLRDEFRLAWTNFAAPPRRNSDSFASPRRTNLRAANDLRGQGEAKLGEFRLTTKRKNLSEAKIMSLSRNDSSQDCRRTQSMPITRRCAKQCGGSFAHLRKSPEGNQ